MNPHRRFLAHQGWLWGLPIPDLEYDQHGPALPWCPVSGLASLPCGCHPVADLSVVRRRAHAGMNTSVQQLSVDVPRCRASTALARCRKILRYEFPSVHSVGVHGLCFLPLEQSLAAGVVQNLLWLQPIEASFVKSLSSGTFKSYQSSPVRQLPPAFEPRNLRAEMKG